jgi:hypothetical protein
VSGLKEEACEPPLRTQLGDERYAGRRSQPFEQSSHALVKRPDSYLPHYRSAEATCATVMCRAAHGLLRLYIEGQQAASYSRSTGISSSRLNKIRCTLMPVSPSTVNIPEGSLPCSSTYSSSAFNSRDLFISIAIPLA